MSITCCSCQKSLSSQDLLAYFVCSHTFCKGCIDGKKVFSCLRCGELLSFNPISGKTAFRLKSHVAVLSPRGRRDYFSKLIEEDSPKILQENLPGKIFKIAMLTASALFFGYLWKRGLH